MIVPWSLEPAGDDVVRVNAASPTDLAPPSSDIVAVALVIESPPVRAVYAATPSFNRRALRGLLLRPGEHILPILSGNPLRLIAKTGTATISLIWLRRRSP